MWLFTKRVTVIENWPNPNAGFSGQMPPPPPYDYNQARALSQIQHNLDYEPPKANAAKCK